MSNLRTQIDEILNEASTYDMLFGANRRHLIQQFPTMDEYWYNYWAARVSFLQLEPGDYTLTFDRLPDATTITLTMHPDYGS